MKRLFLGIDVDHEQTKQLVAMQDQLQQAGYGGERPVKSSNFHMTLAFIGQVEESALPEMINAVDTIANTVGWPKFQVKLDELTLWPKPQILCLSAPELSSPKGATGLAFTVYQCQIIARSFDQKYLQEQDKIEPLNRYTPHITLFRKARKSPLLAKTDLGVSSLLLTPSLLHLYQSVSSSQGVEYRILQSWVLSSL